MLELSAMRYKYLLIVTILCTCGAAEADVYKYIDEDGNVAFADEPPETTDSEVVELPSYDPPSTLTPLARVQRDRQIARDTEQIDKEKLDALVREQIADHDRRCTEARVALEVLHQGIPIYQVSEGKYRADWAGDTYEGPRVYLSDVDREEAITGQLRKLALNCSDPLNPEQQQQASTSWHNEEECRAARVNLEDLLKPGSRAPDQAIEERQKIVDQYCNK